MLQGYLLKHRLDPVAAAREEKVAQFGAVDAGQNAQAEAAALSLKVSNDVSRQDCLP